PATVPQRLLLCHAVADRSFSRARAVSSTARSIPWEGSWPWRPTWTEGGDEAVALARSAPRAEPRTGGSADRHRRLRLLHRRGRGPADLSALPLTARPSPRGGPRHAAVPARRAAEGADGHRAPHRRRRAQSAGRDELHRGHGRLRSGARDRIAAGHGPAVAGLDGAHRSGRSLPSRASWSADRDLHGSGP